MPYSPPDELVLARQLLDEDRYQETLDVLNEFEKKDNLSKEDMIESLLIKGWLYFTIGQFVDAINITEQAFQLSKDESNSIKCFDCLFLKGRIEESLGEDELPLILNKLNKVYLSIKDISPLEKTKREANLNLIEGLVSYYIEVDYEKAVESYNKYLALYEKVGNEIEIAEALSVLARLSFGSTDLNNSLKYAKKSLSYKKIRKRDKNTSYYYLSFISAARGELNLAMEYLDQLQIISDEINNKYGSIWVISNRGFFSRLKGNLDQALEYFKEGLTVSDEFGIDSVKWNLYFNIIRIYIEKGLYEEAKRYLEIFRQFVKQNDYKIARAERLLLFSEGLVLKTSQNLRDRFKAEMILKDFIGKKNPEIHYITTALTHLCDLLLMELRRTGDLKILDELNPLIDQFTKSAEDQESFWRLADAKILQAKLSLIQMNMGKARKLLTQAQVIAEEHDLGILAQKISNEHDTLLKQLSQWEKFKEDEAPVSKRIELSSLDEVVDRLLERRTVEPTKVLDEEPMLLLILAEGGVLLFSYPFAEAWQSNNELFGSFLSAINSFSGEFFSEDVDRFKFGQNTVLMEELENFSIHYLFKGQTYLAQKKLKYFKEKIQSSPSIWQTLMKFFKSGQSIELQDFPFLEAFITDIFMANLSQIREI
ncbi:MAG: hypothetical protein ACFFE4_06270 [Candidatus Thorarchaeota archaeon]